MRDLYAASVAVLTLACARPDDAPAASRATSTDGGEGGAEVRLTWIVMARALELMRAEDGGAPLVDEFFDTPQTYVIGALTNPDVVPPHATVTASFTSYVDFDAPCDVGAQHVGGIKDAQLDPRVGAVVYDNERWCLTPGDEQA